VSLLLLFSLLEPEQGGGEDVYTASDVARQFGLDVPGREIRLMSDGFPSFGALEAVGDDDLTLIALARRAKRRRK
jgi:hypothetical protein